MKGLILKDMYLMGYYKKNFLFLICFAIVFSLIFGGSAGFSYSFFASITMAYMMMTTSALFQFDESAHWNRYVAASPCSRKKTVAARYLFILILLAATAVLSFVLGGGMAAIQRAPYWLPEISATLAIMAGICLVVVSVICPVAYRFGAGKVRVVMMVMLLIPYLLGMLLISYFKPDLSALFSSINMGWLIAAAPAAGLALFGLSFLVSSAFFAKKEY